MTTSQTRLSKILCHLDNPSTGFEQIVGNTPLIYLSSASKEAGCNIYGKAEFLNPGGSIKDRAALWMILNAEKNGHLIRGQPGIIIEGTGGNTGIGLAIAGKALGYKVIIIIPNTQSIEKKTMLRQCGAELIEVEPNPYTSPNHYVRFTERYTNNLKKQLKNTNIKIFYSNQWDNLSNQLAHIEGTGPEIYKQTNGNITLFSCSIGTGGTITGISKYLKSQNKNIKICVTCPMGCDMYNYFSIGKISHGINEDSIVEGVGLNGRVSGQLKELEKCNIKIDYLTQIDDENMMKQLYNLQKYDGIMCGLSSGLNIAGAIKCAKYFNLNKNDVVVTVLCDKATRYTKKIYDVNFLKENNLPYPIWMDNQHGNDNELFKKVAKLTCI
eukprot:267019_1